MSLLKESNLEKRTLPDGGTVYRRKHRERLAGTARPFLRTQSPEEQALSALLEQRKAEVHVAGVAGGRIFLKLHGRTPLPPLPGGYYFKGGAARETLRRALAPHAPQMFIRDFDIVRFAGSDDRHDHELAQRFMRSDYEHGHGVEVVEDRTVYFRTRDLTVNEVLYRDSLIECSASALEDLLEGILRPTPFACNARNEVHGLTLMKAVRLEAEALVRHIPCCLSHFPEAPAISPFEIAVHLDRAFAVSTAVAAEYVFAAWQRKLLLQERGVPPDLQESVTFLANQLRNGLSFFRYLPQSFD